MSADLDRRRLFGGAFAAIAAAGLGTPGGAARADAADEERLHADWPWLGRYRGDNARILAAGGSVDVVFMGDSITEGWQTTVPEFFTRGRVCRGISGQTSPQMLLRFRQDVIDLKPRAVHLMCGTNDIAGNTGPSTLKMIQDNICGMAEIAAAHRVRMIIASIPPSAGFPWRPGLEVIAPIAAMNAWLVDYTRRTHAVYADYFTLLADGRGDMRDGLASDHVHPTAAGYAAMQPVAEAAIARALHRG